MIFHMLGLSLMSLILFTLAILQANKVDHLEHRLSELEKDEDKE